MTSFWQGPRATRSIWSRRQNSARFCSAHHEAGHVVAALHLRRNVHCVEVGENGGGQMQQLADTSVPLPDSTARDFIGRLKRNGARLSDQWIKDDLMLTFAGPAAGTCVGGLPLGGSDEESIRRLIVLLARSEDEGARAFDEAQARARRLVDQYWSVIEDIATRLDEARELAGDHVKAICRRSVLGRKLLGEEEPMRYTTIGALSAADAAREPDEQGLRYRNMSARIAPEDARSRRASALRAMCKSDGYDPDVWFTEWLRMFVSPDPPYRGGRLFGRT
jgi:hypothetical protein